MHHKNFLSSLGIEGWDRIEPFILAGLVLKEPILLVGAPGTGKTYAAVALGKALGLNYHVYDASKGMFEDIIGFPDFKDGEVTYIPTKLSIWGRELIFVDEISRASPEMQNKWLEIIRSRQVMGIPIKTLKYVIGGMNPPGYLGVVGIDLALVDRFAWIIKVPDSGEMTHNDLKKVISTVSFMDHFGDETGRDVEKMEELIEFIEEGEKRLRKLIGTSIDHKLQDFLAFFPGMTFDTPLQVFFNNRRLSMMRRAILSYFAVTEIPYNERDLKNAVFEILPYLIPWFAQKMEPINDYIELIRERFRPENFNRRFIRILPLVEMEEKFWEGDKQMYPIIVNKLKEILCIDSENLDVGTLKPVALKVLISFMKRRDELLDIVGKKKTRLIDEIFIEVTRRASIKWWEDNPELEDIEIPGLEELLDKYMETVGGVL